MLLNLGIRNFIDFMEVVHDSEFIPFLVTLYSAIKYFYIQLDRRLISNYFYLIQKRKKIDFLEIFFKLNECASAIGNDGLDYLTFEICINCVVQ